MSNTQQRWTTTRKKQPTAAERRAATREQALLNCQQGKHNATPTFRPGETVCMTCGLVVYCPVCLDENHLVFPLSHAHPLTCPTHQHTGVMSGCMGTQGNTPRQHSCQPIEKVKEQYP